MTAPGWSVERYKEIIGGATDAVESLRTRDRDRATELAEAVLEAGERAAKASEQEQRIRRLAERRWQSATKALWNERWLAVTPFPDAEPVADTGTPLGADLAEIEAELERAHRSLLDSLDRQPLLRLRRNA